MGKFFETTKRTSHYSNFSIEQILNDYNHEPEPEALFSNTDYTVLWYKEIHNASNRNNSSKLVEVVFENQKTGFQVFKKIPLVAIGSFPIGSIWNNGRTIEKVKFESFSVILNSDSSNVTYAANDAIEESERRFINRTNYPVLKIDNESNTMLVVHQNGIDYVIHPLLFFNALYGVSKHIDRVLLTYTWDEIEDYLALNITDKSSPDAIVIPKQGVIGDAVFLHYLKYDEYTQKVVRRLHAFVRANIAQTGSSPLCVEPYHNQDVGLVFNGHKLDEEGTTVLCTEITGISMPQGKPIEFILGRMTNNQLSIDGCKAHKIKPLAHFIELEEIILESNATPNNVNTAIARHRIEEIGTIRELVKAGNYTEDDVLEATKSDVTVLDSPMPESFADGDRVGFGGGVGIMQVLNNAGVSAKEDKSNFDRILYFAKSLKTSLKYSPVKIDCYTQRGFIGEKVVGCTSKQHRSSAVGSIFVLRIIANNNTYMIFDCSLKKGSQTSGVAIKLKANIAKSGSYNGKIEMVLNQLFGNNGRLSDKELVEQGFGEVKLFKHTYADGSNWVKTALDELG
ncbi:hypothetical protein [Psychrobacter sanguinis]|uniref:hypothetical protein n=1 Tax=Psychrobacter sanguinis TaxID=861445 RepID=UPI002A749A9A|nr:hypothetical protein [Psychrobacter sanguinis]MDY3305921.1 hypothetical protein [Psychrobacter sanguinis]